MRKVALGIMVIVLSLATYATWYSYSRGQMIERNTECERLVAEHYARNPESLSFPPCAYEIVPPSIVERLSNFRTTGHLYPYDPMLNNDVGCDQSATTTDCSKIISLQSTASTLVANEETITLKTFTFDNFSFEHPATWMVDHNIDGNYLANGGDENTGNFVARDENQSYLYIFTAPPASIVDDLLGSINPEAKTLSDYEHDYFLQASTTEDVRSQVLVIESEHITINNIPMLRQLYSIGYRYNGQFLESGYEEDAGPALIRQRYVFFDGKQFVVIHIVIPEAERVVHTIRLK